MKCPKCGAVLARDNRRPGALCSPCDRAKTDAVQDIKADAAREKTMRAAFDVAVAYSQPERHKDRESYLAHLTTYLDKLAESMAMDLPKLEDRWPQRSDVVFVDGPLGIGIFWGNVLCRLCEERPKKHHNGLCATCNSREWRRMKRGAPSQLIEVAS